MRGLPSSPTASVLLDVLQLMSRPEPPAIRWAYRIQPEPQRRPRVDGGRAHRTDEDTAYRGALQMLWRSAKLVPAPLTGELFVAMAFAGSTTIGGTKRAPQPDRTNLEKAVEDAGNGILWVDDIQIVQGFSVVHAWGDDVKPFVSLEVWQLEEATT